MKYVLISSSFFALSAILAYYVVYIMNVTVSATYIWKVLLLGVADVLTFAIGLVFMFISTQPVSRYLSLKGALWYFCIDYVARIYSRKFKAEFDSGCKTPRKTQELLLQKIIKEARDTKYCRDHNISEITSMAELKAKHKLTEYSHYKSYVERTAKGEKNVMVTGLPERLVFTSGTTGEGKLIPCKSYYEISGVKSVLIMHSVVEKYFPRMKRMQPKLFLYRLPPLAKSEGGIDMTSVSYLPKRALSGLVGFAPPLAAHMINTTFEAFYVQLLFGIREKYINYFYCIFTTHLLEATQILEREWPQLIKDLSTGSLNPDLRLSPEVREAITKELKGGDNERVKELQGIFEKGFDGIYVRLWPHLKFIVSTDTVNIKNQLEATYCKGVLIYLLSYNGSEGLFGINVDPLSKTGEYVAFLNCCVFEFIPEENVMESDPDTVFIDEVEIGKRYELVITQQSGLYRYRLGDVVEITGYYYKTPKMKVLYRIGSLLNMVAEKLSSDVVQCAVRDAVSANYPDLKLIFQTVAESPITMTMSLDGLSDEKSKGAHYIFFLEFENTTTDLASEFDNIAVAKSIDGYLYERHSFFKRMKDKNKIHLPTVYLVQPGSFYKLRDYVIANSSATANQFKIPAKLRTTGTFQVMFESRFKKN